MFLDLMESPVNMRNGHIKVTRREVEGFIRQSEQAEESFLPLLGKGESKCSLHFP